MERECQFSYTLQGDRRLPKVVFLHGFMGSSRDFTEIIANLPQFCCLAIDLPSHGQTKWQMDYQMSDVAMAIITLLRELDFFGATLVGYSMGGRIALYLAVYFPQHFGALALESASAGLTTQKERDRRIQRDKELAQKLESIELTEFLQQWYANPLFASLRQHPRYQQMLRQRSNNNSRQLAHSLRQIGLGSQPNLYPHLGQIRLPILIVVGELDRKFVEIGRKIASSCLRASLKIVKCTGHNVHLEHSEQFTLLLQTFLIEAVTNTYDD